jgi:hypothetical protein
MDTIQENSVSKKVPRISLGKWMVIVGLTAPLLLGIGSFVFYEFLGSHCASQYDDMLVFFVLVVLQLPAVALGILYVLVWRKRNKQDAPQKRWGIFRLCLILLGAVVQIVLSFLLSVLIMALISISVCGK